MTTERFEVLAVGLELVALLPQIANPALDRPHFLLGFIGQDADHRLEDRAIDANFFDIAEECCHLIKVFCSERIELVVMALGATERRSHPNFRYVANSVGRILRAIFFGLRPTLVGHAA